MNYEVIKNVKKKLFLFSVLICLVIFSSLGNAVIMDDEIIIAPITDNELIAGESFGDSELGNLFGNFVNNIVSFLMYDNDYNLRDSFNGTEQIIFQVGYTNSTPFDWTNISIIDPLGNTIENQTPMTFINYTHFEWNMTSVNNTNGVWTAIADMGGELALTVTETLMFNVFEVASVILDDDLSLATIAIAMGIIAFIFALLSTRTNQPGIQILFLGLTFMFIIVILYVNVETASTNGLTDLADRFGTFMTVYIFTFIFVLAYFIIGFITEVLNGFKQRKERGEQ